MIPRNPLQVFLSIIVYLLVTPAYSQTECLADLTKNNPGACIANSADRDFSWKLTADEFSLASGTCVADSGTSTPDLVIVLDRSQAAWRTDTQNQKTGADQISMARHLIQYAASKDPSSKIAIVMFSTESGCSEYTYGNITMTEHFPCLYTAAGQVGDEDHANKLETFLSKASDLYSQSGSSASNFSIVADLLKSSPFGFDSNSPVGVVMASDFMSFDANESDVYGYLKKTSYDTASVRIKASFQHNSLSKFSFIAAIPQSETPRFGSVHGDAIDTMCALSPDDQSNCKNVDAGTPATWPVNKVDPGDLASALTGRADQVVTLGDKYALDQLIQTFMASSIDRASIFSAQLDLGNGVIDGTISGTRILFSQLPTGKQSGILKVTTETGTIEQNITYDATRIESESAEFSDKEMYCKNSDPIFIETPGDEGVNLNNLQGGSASCGVIGEARSSIWLGLILLPVAIVLFRFNKLLVVVLFAFFVLANNGIAGEGMNVLNYEPAADGYGAAPTAYPVALGSANFGLSMAYSNDVVELAGEKNKRINSVMDNLVTIHTMAEIGVWRGISLGLHVPLVHKTDLDRSVEGEGVDGGNLGLAGDTSVSMKFRILNRSAFSFSLVPQYVVPTGNPELLIGDESARYGLGGTLSGKSGRFSWTWSLSYMQRQKALEFADDRANKVVLRGQTTTAGGLAYNLSSRMTVEGSLQAKFSSGQSLDLERNSPSEWMSSVEYDLNRKGFVVHGGFGTGLGKGLGSPDYRIVAGVNYVPKQTTRRSTRLTAKRK